MATTPATGGAKPAAQPTPVAKSITGSEPTVDAKLQQLLKDSQQNFDTPDALITHLRGAREVLEALDLDVDQATRATALADHWRVAVNRIIGSREPRDSEDNVRLAVKDIEIHTQLVLTCDALETAVG